MMCGEVELTKVLVPTLHYCVGSSCLTSQTRLGCAWIGPLGPPQQVAEGGMTPCRKSSRQAVQSRPFPPSSPASEPIDCVANAAAGDMPHLAAASPQMPGPAKGQSPSRKPQLAMISQVQPLLARKRVHPSASPGRAVSSPSLCSSSLSFFLFSMSPVPRRRQLTRASRDLISAELNGSKDAAKRPVTGSDLACLGTSPVDLLPYQRRPDR